MWWILAIIVLAFIVYELYVFFAVHRHLKEDDQEHDLHTFSEYIWRFQRRFGWPAKVLVGFACFVLFLHLVFQLP